MRIRITIEYDPDWPAHANARQVQQWITEEKEAWIKGDVDIADILACDGTFELKNV